MQALLAGLTWRRSSLVLIDHLLIVVGIFAAIAIRLGLRPPELFEWWLVWRAALTAGVLQIMLHYCDLYDLRTLRDRRDLMVGLLRALGATSVFLAILHYWVPVLVIGRGVLVLSTVLV